jgi:hypothetical protein
VVFQLDCLTPVSKTQLNIRKSFTLPISIVVLSATAVVIGVLATATHPIVFVDRTLFRVSWFGEHGFTLHTVDFALQRAFTMLVWNLRVPYDLATCAENDLIFLRSRVEYVSTVPEFPAPSNARRSSSSAAGPVVRSLIATRSVVR